MFSELAIGSALRCAIEKLRELCLNALKNRRRTGRLSFLAQCLIEPKLKFTVENLSNLTNIERSIKCMLYIRRQIIGFLKEDRAFGNMMQWI